MIRHLDLGRTPHPHEVAAHRLCVTATATCGTPLDEEAAHAADHQRQVRRP